MKTAIERILELRDGGMSMMEAKRTIQREDVRAEINRAQSIDDLKAILLAMVAA